MLTEKNFSQLLEEAYEKIEFHDGQRVFSATFQSVDKDAALLYAAKWCQYEVCNGGFNQFFANSTGILAPEAIQGLKLLGMPQTADLVHLARIQLPEPYPREREERQSCLAALPKRAFADLERQFYRFIDQENGGFESAERRFTLSRIQDETSAEQRN